MRPLKLLTDTTLRLEIVSTLRVRQHGSELCSRMLNNKNGAGGGIRTPLLKFGRLLCNRKHFTRLLINIKSYSLTGSIFNKSITVYFFRIPNWNQLFCFIFYPVWIRSYMHLDDITVDAFKIDYPVFIR